MPDIRRYCDEIARRFRPRRIVLFGSHAYGTPHEDSDVDVLVVVDDPRDRELGGTIRLEVRAGFPVDVVVRGEKEISKRLELGDWFLREVFEKGRVMYESARA